jgi:hypothetical protein
MVVISLSPFVFFVFFVIFVRGLLRIKVKNEAKRAKIIKFPKNPS